jgi:hypothetical protein
MVIEFGLLYWFAARQSPVKNAISGAPAHSEFCDVMSVVQRFSMANFQLNCRQTMG